MVAERENEDPRKTRVDWVDGAAGWECELGGMSGIGLTI